MALNAPDMNSFLGKRLGGVDIKALPAIKLQAFFFLSLSGGRERDAP
jgi:hypothetical protein